MRVEIPPIIYFMIATVLMVFGPLRAYYFGFKHRVPKEEETPDEARRRKRHMFWGALWLLFGIWIAYMGLELKGRTAAVDYLEDEAGSVQEVQIDGKPTRVKIID